jgi:hypothetical protein
VRDAAAVDKRIRPLALALIRKGDEILVEEGRDSVKNETFSRLLGGALRLPADHARGP